jgi:hypothetical protein
MGASSGSISADDLETSRCVDAEEAVVCAAVDILDFIAPMSAELTQIASDMQECRWHACPYGPATDNPTKVHLPRGHVARRHGSSRPPMNASLGPPQQTPCLKPFLCARSSRRHDFLLAMTDQIEQGPNSRAQTRSVPAKRASAFSHVVITLGQCDSNGGYQSPEYFHSTNNCPLLVDATLRLETIATDRRR